MNDKYNVIWCNKIVFEYIITHNDEIYCIDLDMNFKSFEEFKKHLKEQNYKLRDIPSFRKE